MVEIIPAKTITLRELTENFGLQLVRDGQFFPEWKTELPELSDGDKSLLDRVQDGFFNLLQYPPVLEDLVRMSVVDPLLFIGGFFLYPYYIRSEEAVNLRVEDRDLIVSGRIDTLVLKERLWVAVIESKRVEFSVEVAIAQVLAYMLANPDPRRSSYGLIVAGGSFVFVKLAKGDVLQYATSRLFAIRNPGNELYDVFRILKRLSQIVIEN